MVGLFSWLSKKEDINYEKILSELDDKISQSEMRIAEYGLRERRLLYAWLFYSLPAYAIVLVVYALYYRWSDGEPWNQFLLKSVPVVAMPIIIYLGRAGITAWYQRCRVVQEFLLDELRTRQNEKITELKLKTSFYRTKGLIDRYDGPKSNKSRDGQKLPKGSDKTLDNQQRNLQNNPQQPLQVNPQQNTHQQQQSQPGSPLQLERNISHTHAPNPHHPNSIPSRNATPLQLQHNPQPIRRYSQQQHNAQNNILQENLNTPPVTKNWFDMLLDAMVGETDGPQHKYALICESCFTHNGLVLPDEYLSSKFKCMQCGHLNSKSPPPTSFDFAYSNSRSNVSLNNPSPPSSPTPDFRRRSNSIYSNASYISRGSSSSLMHVPPIGSPLEPELTAGVSDTEGIRQRHIAADTTHDEDLSFEKNASSVKDTSSERGETFSEVDETD